MKVVGDAQEAVFSAQQTLFVSGAGISADAPTNGPLGSTLTRRALRHGFLDSAPERIEAAYRALNVDSQFRPRLEAVLEVLARVHGNEELSAVLSDLSDAAPNDLHRFFADHLMEGGKHITANFDILIERQLSVRTDSLLHIHGSFADSAGVYSLGATLSQIEYGFSEDLRAALDAALSDSGIQHIVFVGYSGSDYFDMTPYLRGLAESGILNGKVVTVIEHADQSPSTIAPDSRAPLIRALSAVDPGPAVIRGRTTEVLRSLARTWSTRPPATEPRGVVAQLRLRTLHASARTTATLELYTHMGLFREVAEFASSGWNWPSAHVAAEYYWARGQYRAYARWAKLEWPGDDPTARARRTHVEANCLWIRGSYRRALRSADAGLEIEDAATEARLRLLELRGRILVHMRYCPDVRWLVTKRVRLQQAESISHYFESHRSEIGVHMRERVSSVLADLSKTANPDGHRTLESSVAAFSEYESLNSAVNYEHARLRQRVRNEIRLVRLEDFRSLRARYEIVGLTEGALRTCLLPGGAYAFPWGKTVAGIWNYDVTRYHQFRLVAGFTLERFRRRSIGVAWRSLKRA